MLSGLKMNDGKIATAAENLKLIAKVKARVTTLIQSGPYKKALKEFIGAYGEIEKLQTQYFQQLAKTYKPPVVLEAIREQSVNTALDSLTDAGIGVNITNKIGDLLNKNITSGAKYSDLVNQLRNFVITNESGAGVLERYTKQITTDSLNQYSAQYTNAVTNDLGLDWFMYTGSLIASSRTFCEALVKKKYIHKSELPNIVLGKFKEFEDMDGVISDKTGLPQGMVAGTTAENFHVYRGGYNCGHQLVPVDEAMVPEWIKSGLGVVKTGRRKPPEEKILLTIDPAGLAILAKGFQTAIEKGAQMIDKSKFEKLLQQSHTVANTNKSAKKEKVIVFDGAEVLTKEIQAAIKLSEAGFHVLFPPKAIMGSGKKNDVFVVDAKTHYMRKVEFKVLTTRNSKTISEELASGSTQAPSVALYIQNTFSKGDLVTALRSGWNQSDKQLRTALVRYRGKWYEVSKKLLFDDKRIYNYLK